LAAQAQRRVPAQVVAQISIDVARTFSSLPRDCHIWAWPEDTERDSSMSREAVLNRVLLACELQSMLSTEASSKNTLECKEEMTYVQGCSMLAAMCLGFTGGREEAGFWLFLYLLDDVLGADFMSQTPPLMGYHGDRSAAVALIAKQVPRVAQAFGDRGVAEATSAVASRCLLSGFVGFLTDEPLLAFWEELLDAHCSLYPRFTLIAWLVGLVRLVEADLVAIAASSSPDEAVPLFFRRVKQAGLALPDRWRPNIQVTDGTLLELRRISQDAAQAHMKTYSDRLARENHAKQISEALERSSARLMAAMKSSQDLSAVS